MSGQRKNKVLRVLLPYGILLLLLVVAELTLRLFKPSLGNPLVTEVTHDGIEWYLVNSGCLKKYFSGNAPLIPEFKTSLFRRQKQMNTFRVFCLGESSMFGTPYQMTCNIPGMVRKQLRHLYPEREIEVVNWGASAINTNVIADLSKDLVRFRPDLVLIYTGHNEFYGPGGMGASFIEKYVPSMISWKYQLRDLRLVALLYNILFSRKTPEQSPNLNLMQQASQGATVRLNSDTAERIFELFAANLKSIVETFNAAGISVIVSDVASNITFPPFISDSLPVAQHMLIAAESTCAGGRYTELKKVLLRHEIVDSTNAAVNFWLGKAELALGEFANARRHLVRARDNDLLKFRAPSQINTIARHVAIDGNIPFISADSLLSSLNASGIAGDECFWEHLHPTPLGYYSIASLFVQEIVRLDLVERKRSNVSHAQLLPFDVDSLSICWLDRAYGDLSIQHLTGRWPFASYRRKPWVLESADVVMRQLAIEAYQRRVDWDEACYKLAAYFWKEGRIRDARTIYEAMLDEYPFSFYTHYLFGSLLNQQHDIALALAHYKKSIDLNPRFPIARLDIGLLQINKGEFDGAIKDLTAALDATMPETSRQLKANIHYGLSAAYANKGDLAKALEEADAALKLQPDYKDALALRAKILQQLR
jgi:tetratricopeptide (TPR) repeat protein